MATAADWMSAASFISVAASFRPLGYAGGVYPMGWTGGYVGGAPGKVNLYVGKKAVRFNIPEEEAVERLVDLIKEQGRWVEAKERAEV